VSSFDGFHLYDLDWSYRASRAGFRAGVAGELLVVHASRGEYDAAWQRQADRFCEKHRTGRAAPAASSFFGATLASAAQARRFFAILAHLVRGERAAGKAVKPA
jgi:GT2 family glycosyltransferase